ncbi:MAG: hypothetical protein RLY83_551 [Actinomycetota bacterium]|jgi:hypothetical protein
MGRHEAERNTFGNRISAPINAKLRVIGVTKLIERIPTRRVWGWALSAALVLVTVVDPYSGTLTAYAAETNYVNYFEIDNESAVTVELTRGGYEVLTGHAATKVFVELAEIPGRDTVQAIAYGKMSAFGWGREQYSCLVKLWDRESNWRINAYNASSGAYGIPQALPGNKMATAGPDWLTNPETQINWGINYIKSRYGSPCSALSHSDRHNWY